jgi:hypothetical protein
MSLSTQLTRGTLALPVLVLFGVLALVAGEPVDASIPESQPHRLVLEARNADAGCTVPLRPALWLAPADLGPIAQRQGNACRA